MAISKNHHTIAQGLLINFCYSNSKIWYYSKRRQNEGICSRDIEQKFRRRHYYSIKTALGERDDRIEREILQVLDSKFSSLAKQICYSVASGVAPMLDTETRNFIRLFIYYQMKRSPDFSETIMNGQDAAAQVADSISLYEDKFGALSNEEKRRLQTADVINDIYNFARVVNVARPSEEILERLQRMEICFAFATGRSEFIIGSNPVVRFENKPIALLGEGDVELWTPISSKVAIGLVGPTKVEFDRKKPFDLLQGQVRLFNEQIFKKSSEVGSSNERLLRSIVFARMSSQVAHK